MSVRHSRSSLKNETMLTLADRHRQADRITSAVGVVAQFESTCDVREVNLVQDHDQNVASVDCGLLVVVWVYVR